jgi:hypothetical protein
VLKGIVMIAKALQFQIQLEENALNQLALKIQLLPVKVNANHAQLDLIQINNKDNVLK